MQHVWTHFKNFSLNNFEKSFPLFVQCEGTEGKANFKVRRLYEDFPLLDNLTHHRDIYRRLSLDYFKRQLWYLWLGSSLEHSIRRNRFNLVNVVFKLNAVGVLKHNYQLQQLRCHELRRLLQFFWLTPSACKYVKVVWDASSHLGWKKVGSQALRPFSMLSNTVYKAEYSV